MAVKLYFYYLHFQTVTEIINRLRLSWSAKPDYFFFKISIAKLIALCSNIDL